MILWRGYAAAHGRTLRDYDLAPRGAADILTAEEASRSKIIKSRLTDAQSKAIARRAADAPWSTIPADADLVDADPAATGDLFAAPADLYWHFTCPVRS
jgi:hypothetical protein